MQIDITEAKTRLSRLIDLVEEGEEVIIARDGKPMAELVAARKRIGLPLGVAVNEPLVCSGDDWWAPMTDEEAEAWAAGKRPAYL